MKVAYTTGTFDMVHAGHFEFLRMIKEVYGYSKIIVGLVTDEYGSKRKRMPYMEYKHRKAILENSKYEVYVIPCNVSDKVSDYERLKFDGLFISDEYFGSIEYREFENKYPGIPVYYLHRDLSIGESTTEIMRRMEERLGKRST